MHKKGGIRADALAHQDRPKFNEWLDAARWHWLKMFQIYPQSRQRQLVAELERNLQIDPLDNDPADQRRHVACNGRHVGSRYVQLH